MQSTLTLPVICRQTGMDISQLDLINIQLFASRVIDMFDYRKRLHEYLHSKINQVAPNLSSLIGDQVSPSQTQGQRVKVTHLSIFIQGRGSSYLTRRQLDQSGQVPGLDHPDLGR